MADENNTAINSALADNIDPNMIDTMKDNDLKILAHMLYDVRENERKEMAYAKRQSRFAVIISGICLAIVILVAIAVLTVVPKLVSLIDNANRIVNSADAILADTTVVISNLSKVTDDLANQDIPGLFRGVDELMIESQNSINEAMDKVNQMDIQTLNEAIQELHAVVQPLAKLFGHR